MLSVTGLNHFYQVGDFTDMRCKHSRVFVKGYTLMLKRMILTDKRRKLTTQRNKSFHYGSDAGAEMAATYHSVIGTVKLHGSSVWNFIGTFFKNIFNGCRDYVNMVPGKITLATSQC